MLAYLRDNKYENLEGIKVPYFDDTGYNNFMSHMKEEEKKNATK